MNFGALSQMWEQYSKEGRIWHLYIVRRWKLLCYMGYGRFGKHPVQWTSCATPHAQWFNKRDEYLPMYRIAGGKRTL